MKISVIIPIYKVEQFLPACLDSIDHIRKSAEMELILVDDGSPDNCGRICDEYASQHSDTKVIHKKNGGLSSARNAGIEVATGDYVWFIDSDDFVNVDVPKVLEAVGKHKADIYCFGTVLCDEEGKLTGHIGRGLDEGEYSPLQVFQVFRFPFSAVQFYIFHRSIFEKFRFKEGILSEDWQFICRALASVNSCYVVNAEPYTYRIRKGSITNSSKTFRYVHDDVEIAQDFYDCLQNDNIGQEGQMILYSGICSMLTSIRRLVFSEIKDKSDKQKSVSYFFAKHFWREALNKAGNWKQKLQYLMMLTAKIV